MLHNIYSIFKVVKTILQYQLFAADKLNGLANCILKLMTLLIAPGAFFAKSSQSQAVRLTTALTELGPLYVKLGQIASTRPDLVGIEVANALSTLQDRVTPFDFKFTELILICNFGVPVSKLFKEFNIIPVASASIAQVYQAVLWNGSIVAVKILRPQVKISYQQTLSLLRSLAKGIDYLYPKFRRLKLPHLVQVLTDIMKLELDLRMEAAAYSETRDNFINNSNLYLPTVYWHLTTEAVLTTSWVAGIPIHDLAALRQQGFDCKELATKLAIISFEQTYQYGFFHADLHHGNILVTPQGQIALLDFGIMGRLTSKDRMAVAEILYGFLNRDYLHVAKTHYYAGYIPPTTDLLTFAQACRAIGEPLKELPLKEISISKLLIQLFKVTEDFGIEVQPQLLLLQKTMLMIEGVGQSLYADLNMWQLAKPWITKWAIKNISPEAKVYNTIKGLGRKISQLVFAELNN